MTDAEEPHSIAEIFTGDFAAGLDLYSIACEALKRRVSAAVLDLREVEGGHRTWYAIDFSEIHALILPEEPSQEDRAASELIGFSHETLERTGLNPLMFSSAFPRILLPPFESELRNFVTQLREDTIREIVVRVSQAFIEAQEILASEDGKAALALAETSPAFTPEQQRFLLDFFQRSGRSLLELVEDGGGAAWKRLQEFFRSDPFEVLDETPLVPVDEESEDVRRYFDYLMKTRRREAGANFLDAYAIELVHRANEARFPAERVVLVSRSIHLRRTVARFKLQEQVPILDSWSFSQLFREPGAKHQADSLERRLQSLELFHAAVESLREAGLSRPTEEDRALLEDHLERMRCEWQASTGLAAAASASVRVAGVAAAGGKQKFTAAGQLLKVLKSEESLRRELAGRISELWKELEFDHETLGWFLPTSTSQRRDSLANALQFERQEFKTVIRADLETDMLPHTVQFFTIELHGLAAIEDGLSLTWSGLKDLLIGSMTDVSEYERLLAMGYCLATLQEWRLARLYLERATQVSNEQLPQSDRHEAFFLLGVVERLSASRMRHLDLAYSHLVQAEDRKRRKLADEDYDDPRYLKEKASVLVRASSFCKAEQRRTKLLEALTLLEKAKGILRNDRRLQALVANSTCYALILLGDASRAGSLRAAFGEFSSLMSQRSADVSTWPAAMIDTYVLGALATGQVLGRERAFALMQVARSGAKGALKGEVVEHVRWLEQHFDETSDRLSRFAA